ncbi:MAG TPA: phosphatase PAP2 family protein [Patescibacteria group bacterium]|nr:phosphatase PAP2 family protein [Patescibacteria group bacterium]
MNQPGLRNALRDYRLLYLLAFAYVAAVLAETVIYAVPVMQFMRVGWAMLLVTFKCLLLLGLMAAWIFLHRLVTGKGGFQARCHAAQAQLSATARAYTNSELFAYACAGFPVLYAINFFFIQKSLIAFVNPYDWDPLLAVWDKALHFGHYPHSFLVPIIDRLGLATYLDIIYYVWFVVLYIGIGFNLFLDRDKRRRLQFYWVFFLSWVVIGSAMALAMSSVGPLFFARFYPTLADPYVDLVRHFNTVGPQKFIIAYTSRDLLVHWATNGNMVNVNALSAMPSLHVAIAWLMVLYAWRIGRAWFVAAALFCGSIFLASVYFGFHYAFDGYVSIVMVSLLWRGVGIAVNRHYAPDPEPRIGLA